MLPTLPAGEAILLVLTPQWSWDAFKRSEQWLCMSTFNTSALHLMIAWLQR
jgi:hypothetical protein